jgi:2-polyprenyl-3-methyl-5-hydroxy-6-metoxy-1,4-benzoquinol methylase
MIDEKSSATNLSEEYNGKKVDGYFLQKRHEMLNYIPQFASRILDVGCAGGNFGELLKKERCVEVWGVEPNEAAAKVATQKLDKVICNVFSSKLEFPKKYFDCIIFNDVLEHLVDPCKALSNCEALLNDRGVIIASIPNVRYFDNIWNLLVLKKWEYTDWGILDKTHLRFFTRQSIEDMLKQLGYVVLRLEGINPLESVHPHHVRKFNFLNWLSLKHIEDMRFLQFAVVALPIRNKDTVFLECDGS